MTLVTKTGTDIYLPIRRVTQLRQMECWYIAASTVLGYRNPASAAVAMSSNIEAISRDIADTGLNAGLVDRFAAEVGLGARPVHALLAWYATSLRRHGPLWTAVRRPSGGHVVVICGTRADGLLIADPDPSFPFPLIMRVAAFNRIAMDHIPFLYKD
jgi:Papain-like cysteine protease AvrRpt2